MIINLKLVKKLNFEVKSINIFINHYFGILITNGNFAKLKN